MRTNAERPGETEATRERQTLTSNMTHVGAIVNDALEAMLSAAAEAGARAALEQLPVGIPRWIPLKESPLGYRPTLDLIRSGELKIHGIGHRRYLDREQVDRWMLDHPIRTDNNAATQDDEIAGVIALNRKRHEKRGRK